MEDVNEETSMIDHKIKRVHLSLNHDIEIISDRLLYKFRIYIYIYMFMIIFSAGYKSNFMEYIYMYFNLSWNYYFLGDPWRDPNARKFLDMTRSERRKEYKNKQFRVLEDVPCWEVYDKVRKDNKRGKDQKGE